MWILFAFGSAFFAGVTAVLAKCGIRKTDSTVATAVRTTVVLVFAWLMVFITGAQGGLASQGGMTLLFLALSGLATGASWLCYFKALQLGDINKVVPIDKSSILLTMLLAFLLLGEPFTLPMGAGFILVGAGTFLMIEKKDVSSGNGGKGWFLYACGSAVFAALTSILGKIGIEGVDSNLGTALRTAVVLVMAWAMVGITGKGHEVGQIPRRELLFICLSGIATGGLLALLLPGLAGRPRQHRRPDRQAEHPGYRCLFLPRLPRKADEKVRPRPCFDRRRHAGHAAVTAIVAGASRRQAVSHDVMVKLVFRVFFGCCCTLRYQWRSCGQLRKYGD